MFMSRSIKKYIFLSIIAALLLFGITTIPRTKIYQFAAINTFKAHLNETNKTKSISDYNEEMEYRRKEVMVQRNKKQIYIINPQQLDETNTPKNVIILAYHAVNNKTFGMEDLFIAPAEFDKQMNYLKENNYTTISFNELENASKFKKPVIITFDDGYEDNFYNVYPILKKYGLKATIFVCSDFVDKNNMLKKWQMIQMQDLVSFQSHTASHVNLTKITPEEMEMQLSKSKSSLEYITGKTVDVIAYPEGRCNDNVVAAVQKYYKIGLLSYGGVYHPNDNPYLIKRLYIPRKMDMSAFEKKLKDNAQ